MMEPFAKLNARHQSLFVKRVIKKSTTSYYLLSPIIKKNYLQFYEFDDEFQFQLDFQQVICV